ncbi:acyl-CoA thioesterase [Pannonibacter tanglangensis]|uniref:Acyl-CoA thioesterase n=1 Tax=Pannonibacter tanglangensis TaxID=2750084 RepID=A0ABW9ZHP3_9HYPH|nr:thioesterase family protein [Pannonibacter sp. XCT-34]NBN62552.1 acyl-CoA thioesterase [Pannonibacter sp. XCT-34]
MTDTPTGQPTSSRPDPLQRSDFALFRPLPTRWMDVDIYGHVNNVVYLSFFDSAVNGWYVDKGLIDPQAGREIFLVVETGCHYFRELRFPETVEAGIRATRVGRSSVSYEIALFGTGDTEARAQGRFVHVLVDRSTRRPVPIVGERRDALQGILVHRQD